MNKAYLLLALAASAVSAFGVSINTGSAAWTCTSAPQACTVTNLGVTPNGVWAPAQGGAQWIGPQTGAGDLSSNAAWPLGGNYVYTLALSGFTNGNFSFIFAADNGGKVELIGAGGQVLETPVPFNTPNGTGYTPAFSATGIFAGTATAIRVTVFNDTLPPGGSGAPSPSGFFLAGQISDVPEPSTWAMLSLGGAAIVFSRLRRKA